MNPAREWNAESYHRLSQPQVEWGERVLARVPLVGDETVLDAGCGSGRLTASLLERLPAGHVVAVDQSQNMLEVARENLGPRFGDRVSFVRADIATLELPEPIDIIFSTATLHWVTDHPRLFRTLYRALKPGGLLLAQCGGAGNLAHVLERVYEVLREPPYDSYFAGWQGPWEFADAETTTRRLRDAGFVDVETGLEAAPTILADAGHYREFVSNVIFRLHLDRMPNDEMRKAFLDRMTAEAAAGSPPFLLDYQRLNLSARRPEIA